MLLERQIIDKLSCKDKYISALFLCYSKKDRGSINFNNQEINESLEFIKCIRKGRPITADNKHYHIASIVFAAYTNNKDLLNIMLANTIYPFSKEYTLYSRIVCAYMGHPISDEVLETLPNRELHDLAEAAGAGNNLELIDRLCNLDEVCLSFAIRGAKEWNQDDTYNYLKFRSLSFKKVVSNLETKNSWENVSVLPIIALPILCLICFFVGLIVRC
jgi:hypothetical protein